MGLAHAILKAAWCISCLCSWTPVSWNPLLTSIRPRSTPSSSLYLLTLQTSACFAAGYRLAVTIAYSKSQDTTYTFCTVGIWVVVETTCGLIVLCMPAFPKAVSELGVTKVYISLKSWATTQSRNKSSSAIDDSVARFAESHRLKAQKDPWQELDTSTTALGDELESVGTYENGIELGTNTPHKDSTILRTTQISIATKDNGQDHIHDFNRQRNSPWAPRDPRYESR